jgi:hypothetical protein
MPVRTRALTPTPTPTPTPIAVFFKESDSVDIFESGVLVDVVVAAALLAGVVDADALGVDVEEAEEVCVCVKLSPMMVNV